ncbi:MAG: B12-binding domain-containing radical SAM protein, partial [Deltaproteobacteria bacterium]
MNETLERIEQLAKCALFLFCGMRIYPQTELNNLSRHERQVDDTRNLLEPVFYHSSRIGSEEILTRVRQ